MEAVFDQAGNSRPLSAEQQAVVESHGGEDAALQANHRVRVRCQEVTADALQRAVMEVLASHDGFHLAICRQPGYRGLRLRLRQAPAPLDWREINEAELDGFMGSPLALDNGELLRAGLLRDDAGHTDLVLAVSSLAADPGSLATLVAQIADVCRDGEMPEALFQASQYRQWRDELDSDPDTADGHDYWKQYLVHWGSQQAPRLGYRVESYEVDGGAGVEHRKAMRYLDANTLNRVVAMAEHAETEPEVLLQAIWWLLLSRLTGFAPFAAGWQHDCRHDYDLMQGAVGNFDKVLPMAIDAREDETFADWLARFVGLAEAHLDVQEQCPLDALTASVGFGYHGHSAALPDGWRSLEQPGAMPGFELALWIEHKRVEHKEGVEGNGEQAVLTLSAAGDHYPQGVPDCLLDQYLAQLEGALTAPETRVSDLPWMTGEEEQRLLAAGQGEDLPMDDSLSQRVTRWAQQTPDAPAIETGTQALSYAELDVRANRLARWMREQGVEPGSLVALMLPRSPDLIVAMLASWRLGAAFLPLEPDWPTARREAVLADAQPRLILTAVDDVALEAFSFGPLSLATDPEDTAYVLYTSGSTGKPKGVVIEQRQLLNYVIAASRAMALENCRRWGLTGTVAADLGNTALFVSLFHGACLIIADDKQVKSAEAFARFVAESRIDAVKMVPSHLEALLESDNPRLPGTLVLGGETPSPALVERLFQLAPACALYNHYGPTEATVGVMVHRITSEVPLPEVLPLSTVLANNRVRVLDASRRPVPVGALGELYIGGAQVCRGYLNRDVEGAFVDDPVQPGQRLYRTGDLARLLPDGSLCLAGRADHQVKIRGFRIELAEVESALQALPGVRQAVVTLCDDRLHAFVIAEDGSGFDEWRKRLAEQLPDVMCPTGYTLLETFPRLANGKIDRRALVPASVATTDSGAAPATAVEALLADAMAELLDKETLSADADFFEAGGHSLLVVRLVARIRKAFGIDMEPGLVFDHSSPQSLARWLCQDHDAAELEQLAVDHGERANSAVKEAH